MTTRCARAAARIACLLSCLSLPTGLLWAQNENETVGFQSNHIFESGQFGEDIDVLNGGLHLTTPIGPKYQVNDRLSFQLVLHYNTKIWENSDYASTNGNTIKLINEGALGLGFTLSFGRLLQDVHNTTEGYERTWKWVTPDGNQHDVWHYKASILNPAGPTEYLVKTADSTYVRVHNDGTLTAPGPFTVSTPDGLTYTLAQHIGYPDSIDPDVRADNLNFGGWYVTRIEDRSIGSANVTNSFGTTGPISGLYPNHVVIVYDTRPNFTHAIKEIRDSQGRVITFTNCRFTTGTTCVDDQVDPADRSRVATKEISLPAFSVANANNGLETIDTAATAKAIYRFTYTYGTVNRFHSNPNLPEIVPAGPTVQLKRLDYPEYVHPNGTHETYSMYFGYETFGEVNCRTLPLPMDPSKACIDWRGQAPNYTGGRTVFTYDYGQYTYLPLHVSAGSQGMGQFVGTPTRQITAKHVLEPQLNAAPVTRTWSYVRDMSTGTTNPNRVTLTDAVGNDTVYYYRASYSPWNDMPGLHAGEYPDDGLAPEWNDGLNHRIEYFRGTGTGRFLVRSEAREYETDSRDFAGKFQKSKENSRVQRTATIYNDDGASERVIANSGWDGFGNWRTVAETGFGVPGVRSTHTDYFTMDPMSPGGGLIYLTGLPSFTEVHDGFRVLGRTENSFDSTGRLSASIARKTLPATLGSPNSNSFLKGDVKTTYEYDLTTKILTSKSISSGGDGVDPDMCIAYSWTMGAYLKSKTFGTAGPDHQCATGSPLSWKAIDRKRDGNTGLIYSVRDPAGLETRYLYDSLGRVTDITPSSTEFRTSVDYVSLQETTVTRNPDSATDFGFSRYRYDDLGRMVCEERRPASGTSYPYQTTRYDPLGHVVFKSEWLSPGSTPCNPSATIGTTSDYGTPPDPFGRVATVTTADGKITTTTYQGQDTTVTVQGVMGPGGVAGPVTTRYFRDAWGRLINVQAPAGGGANAVYVYDLRDNLTRVDLYDQVNPLLKQSRYFEYDGLNRLFQTINPESNATVYGEYDGLGNPRLVTGADGVTLQSSYDPAGRLKSVQRSGTTTLLVENTYDAGTNAAGKISTSISRDDYGGLVVSKAFAYTGLNGRLSSLSQTFGAVSPALPITYHYDNYGNVDILTYPEGPTGKGGSLTVNATYLNGIPVSAQEQGTGLSLASVTYNPAGGIQTLVTPGSMRSEITPDSRNRPAKITIGNGTYNPTLDTFSVHTDYQSGTFSYDGAGNIFQMERLNGLKNLYRYDAANRLVEAYDQVGAGLPGTQYTQCFRYDDFGNILGKKDRVTTSSCAAITDGEDLIFMVTPPNLANTNRIISEQRKGIATIVNFAYDAKGNALKDWERRYSYDTRNRMVSVSRVSNISDMSSPATDLGLYSYDAEGNRVIKLDRLAERRTYYVRGPDGRVLSEFRRTELGSYQPEWVQHHVYLAGREVALRENRIPNPPGALSVTTTRNGSVSTVFVKWKKNPAEDNVTSYQVYRWNGTAMVPLGTSNTPCADPAYICYTDAGVPSDGYFQYQVTAMSANGESYGSDLTWLDAGDITAPYRPICLTGGAADQQVSLSWTASVSDDILGYNVYRRLGTSGPGQYSKINAFPVASTYFLDNGLTNDQVYSYRVRAVDQVGTESPDVVNGGKTCLGTGVACTTDADCTCPECEPQCVYVCGSTSNTTFSAMPKDAVPPGPPREISVVGDCSAQGTAQVTWTANATTDDVKYYWVYRTPDFSPAGPRSSGNDALGQPKLYFDDTGLASGTTYFYSLKAEDTKVNRSVTSLQVGTKPRAPSGLMSPPPGQISTKAGDGQVRVRFQKPANMTGIGSFVIYRKPNAEPSCTAYQEVHDFKSTEWPPNAPYLEYNDGTVGNAIAWDYVVASRDWIGNESALSKVALAIPVATPKNYRECVEEGGEGSIACPLGQPYRRTVMRWSPPPGKPYHPVSATNADGTLGYLDGYHLKRYTSRVSSPNVGETVDQSYLVTSPFYDVQSITAWEAIPLNLHCSTTGPSSNCIGEDFGYCQEWESCVSMGQCYQDTYPTCTLANVDADCPAGTGCWGTCSKAPTTNCRASSPCGAGKGTCSATGQCYMTFNQQDAPMCVQKADCPAPASCRRYGELGPWIGPIPTDPFLHEGADLEAHYPRQVFLKECGTVSAVYKVYADGNWQSVDSESTNFDPTKIGADSSEENARCTTVLAQCAQGQQPHGPLCADVAVEPPQVTQAPTVTSPGPGRIKVTWDSYAGSTNAAGYYLYVKEINHQSLLVNKPPHPYGFGFSTLRPYVSINLNPPCFESGKPCYELTGIPTKGRLDTNVKYQFQIAVVDNDGNVGRASPLSAEIMPQTPVDPVGLKIVIWTVNDASRDGFAPLGVANPRSFDGIKLQWTGSASRVYRSEGPDGPYCLIVKQGSGNPTDRPLCFDSTAGSTTATTGNRFFHDKNVVPGKVYYYKLTALNGSVESNYSSVVQGMALKHAALPLSPPRHLKAWAPMVKQPDATWDAGPGMYLRWCPNPPEEGVTGYRIYRSTTPGGPYTTTVNKIADLDNPTSAATLTTNCLMGSQRCEIRSTTCTGCTTPPCLCKSGACTIGPGGTCKVVDLYNIAYPNYHSVAQSQTQKYYYVVTALRGTEESAFSNENVGLPNYYNYSCPTCDPPYYRRFDPDNEGDIACDDEMSEFEPEQEQTESLATLMNESGSADLVNISGIVVSGDGLAPYRVIGEKIPSSGGGGANPTPSAVSRWLFYHTDHLGSPRVIADVSGAVVSTHHYMPFGEEKPIPGRVSSNSVMFTGHQRDIESASSDNPDGLDYMMARYYSSSLGRFMAVDSGNDTDPEKPQSWNKYAYARNNPLNAIDPKGTSTFYLPANQQQMNQAIATAPAGAARMQQDQIARDNKEAVKANTGGLLDAAGPILKGAALVAAVVLTDGMAAVVAGISEAVDAINVTRDVVDAASDTNGKNVGKVVGDAAAAVVERVLPGASGAAKPLAEASKGIMGQVVGDQTTKTVTPLLEKREQKSEPKK